MRTLIVATALSTLLLVPAYAQQAGQSQQKTETQESFSTSVKAKQPTAKHQQIIRSEEGTNGAAPKHIPER